MDDALEKAMREFVLGNDKPPESQVSRYTFEPLDGPETIRTLELRGISGDTIDCSIQHVNILKGQYQALSYVWGSEERPFKATVRAKDGTAQGYIPLTTNLRNALHDLWSADGLKSKVFWIDQICIDQDGEEKSHQVALMGRIYRSATMVITYIGPAAKEQEEKRGIELLQRLHLYFAPDYQLIYECRNIVRARQRISDFPVVSLPQDLQQSPFPFQLHDNYVAHGWRWLAGVAFGEWTQRLWVVQEQLLNPRTVMLRGPRLLLWEAVAVMPILFDLGLLPESHVTRFWMENKACGRPTSWTPWHNTDSVFSLWYDRRRMHRTQSSGLLDNRTLLENMVWYQNLECRDPRDRIFALLAISSDAAILDITPDYSDHSIIPRVFAQASVSMLRAGLGLVSVACQWNDMSNTSLPSWVVHSRRPPEFAAANIPSKVCSPHPRTSLPEPPRFRSDDSVLVLKGRPVDRISMATSPAFYTQSMIIGTSDRISIEQSIKLLSGWSAVLARLGVNLDNAASLCRAIIADPGWSPHPQGTRSSVQEMVFHLWCHFRFRGNALRLNAFKEGVNVIKPIQEYDILIKQLSALIYPADVAESLIPHIGLNLVEQRAADEFRRRHYWRGRSFCVTDHGRICSAMNEAREGDVVVALQGADRLFLVRPEGHRFRLVGDAYVDGLMAGEAYDGLDPDVVDHDIELV